jgi:16S rRNA (guanine527-N7)-methyltransferase
MSAAEAGRWKALLERDAAQMGLRLEGAQLDAFWRYLALLADWNQRLNLTAISGPEPVRLRHFLDSLSCTLATGELNGRRLVDVGAGAGFPGLALKICFPSLHLTLVESVAKKCRFLEAVIVELGLAEVDVIAERAESVGRLVGHRENYDWAVARAVAELSVLAEYLLPLCRVGGAMLAQKGPDAAEEAVRAGEALRVLGGSRPQVIPVRLPGLPAKRPLGR